jgi:hypothetical protein
VAAGEPHAFAVEAFELSRVGLRPLPPARPAHDGEGGGGEAQPMPGRGGSEGRVGAEAELSRAAGFGPLLRHARGAGAEGTFGGCGAQLPPGGLAGRGESEGGGGARRR